MFQAFAWHLLQLLRPWLCVLQTTHFAEHLVPLAFTGSLVTYTSDVANDSASLCFTGGRDHEDASSAWRSGVLINGDACSVSWCTAKWVKVFFFFV